MKQSDFNPKEQVDLEVIIGSRNEGHDVISTIHSLVFALEATPLKWRIILMDSGSDDFSTKYLLETRDGRSNIRGIVNQGFVQVYYYPWVANVGVRDHAVRNIATAKYIAFADAHISVDPQSFNYMLETLEKHKPAMVHSSVDYWGAHDAKAGQQYSIKFGEKGVYGTWTNIKAFDNNTPFFVGALGHCFLLMKRDTYLKIGGYNPYLRNYGGGELLLCLAGWMVDEGCITDPRAHVYHSMFGRGYVYDSIELVHNYFLATYIIGGEKYSATSLMTYYQQKPYLKPIWKKMYDEAMAEAKEHRDYIVRNQKMSFEEVIGMGKPVDCDGRCRIDKTGEPHVMRPWDKKNQDIYGKHLSFVREFELKEENGVIKIGNLDVTDPDAIALYNDLKSRNVV